MDMNTYLKVMEWLKYFVRKGTQTELNLYGIGEPSLNPLLPEFIKIARGILPMRYAIHINTNGAWIDTSTIEITQAEIDFVKSIRDAGISHVDVTGHHAFKTAKANRILTQMNVPGSVSHDFMLRPNNWAGQVDWFAPTYDAGPCPWVGKGQAFVLSSGDITRCCIDAFGTGVIGSVYEAPSDIQTAPFDLCKRCHHRV
jgi:hypothetical protein